MAQPPPASSFAMGRQERVAVSQAFPGAHSSLESQAVRQVLPRHTKGAQETVLPSEATSSVPSVEHVPPSGTHLPSRQAAPSTHSAEAVHRSRQAVPSALQRYAPQSLERGVGQLPLPSQDEALVALPSLQLATAHETSEPGCALHADRSLPSQRPCAHGFMGSLGQVRAPRGAPETGEQVPSWPTTLHAPHGLVQALSQQTPSTQCPLPHSASAEHDAALIFTQSPTPSGQVLSALHEEEPQQTPARQVRPGPHAPVFEQSVPFPGSGTQTEVAQAYPAAQSALVVQAVLQVLPPQPKPPHALGVSPHAPAPSQVPAWVSTPAVHAAAPHGVPEARGWQALLSVPSHASPHAVVGDAHGVREPCGAPTTGRHLPTLPPTSHAAQASVHALSQQTPSTQKPVAHSLAEVQPTPCFLAQVPLVTPLQARPALQDAVEQQTKSTQFPDAHSSPVAQAVPSDCNANFATVETTCASPGAPATPPGKSSEPSPRVTTGDSRTWKMPDEVSLESAGSKMT
jgi:hypothetical protein